MKYLLMAAAATLLFTGCHTRPDHAGSPGDGTYTEVGPNNRNMENRATDNIRDAGRQSSPTSPFTSGNGTLNR